MSSDAEAEKPCGSCTSEAQDGSVVAMDLLDEYWFFHNTLNSRRISSPRPPLSPNKGKGSGSGPDSSTRHLGRRASMPENSPGADRAPAAAALLRTPSLPPPRIRREESVVREEAAAAAPLRPSRDDRPAAARPLVRAPSLPLPEEAAREEATAVHTKPGKSRLRHTLSSLDGHPFHSHYFTSKSMTPSSKHRQLPRYFKIEGTTEYCAEARRLYPSEAGRVQRPGSPFLDWVNKDSAEDMKEQLKFWARAVACNVRQEC